MLLCLFPLLSLVRGEQYNSYSDGYFSNAEMRQLHNLQGKVCAYSPNSVKGELEDPWYCVRPHECEAGDRHAPVAVIVSSCHTQYNLKRTGETRCCHIGQLYIANQRTVTAAEEHWGVDREVGPSYYDHNLFYKYTLPFMVDLLTSHAICALRPGYFDGRGDLLYIPYLCTIDDCPDRHYGDKPGIDEQGNLFCEPSGATCCHPYHIARQLNVIDEAPYSVASTFLHFTVRELPPALNYSHGFRSSFQCEQYSRHVCESNKDRCSLRVVRTDDEEAVPGFIPHQALIGIQDSSTRFFHCSGALVSKYYIISAKLCRYHDRIHTSVALVGDYDTNLREEFGSREQLTYLVEVEEEPSFVGNALFYRRARLALFRTWRPISLHYWVRPACINWGVRFKSRGAKTIQGKVLRIPEFPKETTFSGFGPVKTGGRRSQHLKLRYFSSNTCNKKSSNCNFNDFPSLPNEKCDVCDTCQRFFFRYPDNRTRAERIRNPDRNRISYDKDQGFCQTATDQSEGTSTWGPCELDLGSPASAYAYNFTPYCQWALFGIQVNPKEDCLSNVPALYRVVATVVPWLESVIWRNDFHPYEFKLSLPDCHESIENTFDQLIHMNGSFDRFYRNTQPD